jgi:hypothetical protein
MKYSETETRNLSAQINKDMCLEDLNDLIVKEGCSETLPVFVNNEIVLDMDCVELKLAKAESRKQNKSMDSAFVIADNSGTKKDILLVEFRFNYTNMKNLDRNELEGKVSGSLNSLKSITNIHTQHYFIFDSSLKNQALSRLNRMNPRIPTYYIATDISEFKSMFF